jgi:acyl-lipid omega-6 desaturase (Delta-12 desaturase)
MDGTAAAASGATSLQREDYQRLRTRLDFTPSFLPTAAILLMDALLVAGAIALLRMSNPAAFMLSQILLSVVFFNAFSILHECGHGTTSKHGWLNAVVGHAASTFCFIPYYPWKYIHQKHHTWTGNIEQDPVLKSLRTWRERGVPWIVRAAWWSWIPLGALLQHLVYLTYPVAMWRARELTGRKLLRSSISLLWLPGSHLALWALAPDLVRPQNFLVAIVLFLVVEELVNIPHHVGMSTFDRKLPAWEQYRATRSCYYPPGLSEVLVLNFNFHIEHHLFPSLPWFRLRAARTLLREVIGSGYQEAVGIGWNIRNRKRDLQTIVDQERAPALYNGIE